ncbi:MAG TPA: hypothetical protein VNB06_09790 [Thermoanaerobaculia bacterium]|nr:hypothetical protein [Thermoanaerobaculia bacterium]
MYRLRSVASYLASFLFLTTAAVAQDASLGPLVLTGGQAATVREAPSWAGLELEASLASLSSARQQAMREIERLEAANAAGLLPVRNGFRRGIPPRVVRIEPSSPNASASLGEGEAISVDPDGGVRWIGRIEVEEAWRLRAHLEAAVLPPGTRMWVYNSLAEVIGPVLVTPDPIDGIWTPSVEGPSLILELHLPEAARDETWSFEIDEVLEVFRLDATGRVSFATAPDISCAIDATCVTGSTLSDVASLRRAVAHLQFVKGGEGFVCTGSLLNNTLQDGTPNLLTANHCLANQSATNTLESFWDYKSATCGGSTPNLGSLQRSSGGQLLATSANGDYTLIRLSSIPANRILLGWTTTPPANGALLHRISHPLGLNQAYSSATVLQHPNPALSCGNNTNRFIATDPLGGQGATFGGSSGAAMVNAQLQVVGDLSGGCGPNVDEPCDGRLTDLEWDGRFSAYFPALAPFLSPSGGGGNTSPCQVANGVECLVGNRFELSASFQDQNGNSGPIRLIRYTDSSVLGHYGDGSNIEILGKVLNGCPLNGQWWVFLAGVTDQGVEVRVRDTQTGRSYSYSNPLGRKYVTDTQTSAIPCQ